MSEPDADHYRYRALLRDANDESKRLALIQLLIDERAREKLAAQLKTAKAEVLPEHQPFVPPVPRYWGVPQKVVGPAERRWSGEINMRSIKSTMQMDVLRCKTPEMVLKEIWAHLLAYNCSGR